MTDTNALHYREAFKSPNGALASVRREAFESFEATGFPTRQLEEWRYTNPAPITRVAWQVAQASAETLPADFEAGLPDFGGSRLVFIDGRFAKAASKIDAGAPFVFTPLAQAELEAVPRYAELADGKTNGFTSFNTAFADDGVALRIEATDSAPAPVHIVFASSTGENEQVTFPRLWVRAEGGSRGCVVVDHISLGPGDASVRFTCAAAEAFVGENASLDLTFVQRENASTFHVARHCVEQERDSSLRVATLALGGALVRNDLEVRLAAPGAVSHFDGLFLGSGDQLVDNHTLVDHAVPRCESHERYKGIVADEARGVFRGRVLVRPDAQHTNATQQNQNLVLSAGAEIDTKPQLEIYADDVSCSHGSSIGKLDEEALFFLRARGLDPAFARRLLMSGFSAEITLAIADAGVRTWAEDVVAERLDALIEENA